MAISDHTTYLTRDGESLIRRAPNRVLRAPVQLWLAALLFFGLSCGAPIAEEPLTVVVSVAPAVATATVGGTVELRATVSDSKSRVLSGRSLQWQSSDERVIAIATPSGDKVFATAISEGAARITAADIISGSSGTASVTVGRCISSGDVMRWPLCGDDRSQVTQDYAEYDGLPPANGATNKTFHTGLDILAQRGRDVHPAADGWVVLMQRNVATDDHRMGNSVIVEHTLGGTVIYTQYSHLQDFERELENRCRPNASNPRRGFCASPVHINFGDVIGHVGGTSGGSDTAPVHLHFEVKERPVLHNPRHPLNAQVEKFMDDDPCASVPNTCAWGYSGDGRTADPRWHPDNYGFRDPLLFLHATSDLTSNVFRTRVRATLAGAGIPLRFGPGASVPFAAYPSSSVTLTPGKSYWVDRRTVAPGCAGPWLQLRSREVVPRFPRPGNGELVDVWACSGPPNAPWLEFPHVLAASLSSAFGGQGPPSDIYDVQVAATGVDRHLFLAKSPDGSEPELFDIARTSAGEFFAVSRDRLFTVDTLARMVRSLPNRISPGTGPLNALTVDPSDQLLAATGVDGRVFVMDKASGSARQVGTFGGQLDSFGDIAFNSTGEMFAAVRRNGIAYVAKVDARNGFAASLISPTGPDGFGNVFGLTFVDDELIGFTFEHETSGWLLLIDTRTGLGQAIRKLSFGAAGAARIRNPSLPQ